MEVRLESPEAIVEAMGTNNPELVQRLVNQVYETLWMPAELSEEERSQRILTAVVKRIGLAP